MNLMAFSNGLLKNVFDFLFKPRLLFLSPKKDVDVALRPSQLAIRLVVGLITFVWIGCLPFYLFVIFMHQNNFFSYDFFVDGVFGLKVFTAVISILLVFTSLYFYGFLIIAKLGIQQQSEHGKNNFRMFTWVAFLLSILTHSVFFRNSLASGNPSWLFWLMAMSLFFCMFIYSFVGHGLKKNSQNWISPIAFVAATILFPFVCQNATSEMISVGLRSFRIGGGMHVDIIDNNSARNDANSIAKGSLLLLTPKNAYIKNEDNILDIVPISEHTKVHIW